MDGARLLNAIDMAVNTFFNLIYMVISVKVFLSWIPGGSDSSIYALTSGLLDPFLGPIQRMIRKSPISKTPMMIDFSPIVLGMFMTFIQQVLFVMIRSLQYAQ